MSNTPVPTTPPEVPETEAPSTERAWLPRLIVILVFLFLIIGGLVWGYLYFGMSTFDDILDKMQSEDATEIQPENVYPVEFDVFTSELYAAQGESRLVSITLSLDANSQIEAEEIEKRKLLIEDVVTRFLHGLRPDDFVGNLNLERVREQLTRRIVAVVDPLRIKSVYIRNISFAN